MKNTITIITSTLATTLVYLFGGWDVALESLLIVIVIDYLSGLGKAFYQKKLDSRIGLKGIIKKIGYLLVVVLSVVIDRIMGSTGAIRTLVIYFFVANEGLSILENWGAMGLPLPKKLFEVLDQLKSETDNKTND